MRSYYGLVVRRLLRDTWAFAHGQGLIVAVVAAVLAPLLALAAGEKAGFESAGWALGGLGVVALAALVVFTALAPVRIDRESREQVAGLEAELCRRDDVLRRAARLVRSELLDIQHKMGLLHKDPTLSDKFRFPAFKWDEYESLFAERPELYQQLDSAYATVHHINQVWDWRREVSTSRLIAANLEADGIEEADVATMSAIEVLDEFIASPGQNPCQIPAEGI